MPLSNDQKEELRHATLEEVAARAPAALSPRQIQRAVKRALPFLFEEADVTAALELLKGLPQPLVIDTRDELGGTRYWAATSEGVLFVERRQ